MRHAIEAVEDVKRRLEIPAEQRPHTTCSITDGALLRLVSTIASNHEMSQYVVTEQERYISFST